MSLDAPQAMAQRVFKLEPSEFPCTSLACLSRSPPLLERRRRRYCLYVTLCGTVQLQYAHEGARGVGTRDLEHKLRRGRT